jgi:hypothetical protein
VSGWFADPVLTKRFVLGDCRCPGKPHDEDWWDVRSSWSGTFTAELEAASPAERLRLLIVDWNLHNEDGKVPIEGEWLDRLYLDVFDRLNGWMDANVERGALPNGSGAPSRNGTKASASHTRTTRSKP